MYIYIERESCCQGLMPTYSLWYGAPSLLDIHFHKEVFTEKIWNPSFRVPNAGSPFLCSPVQYIYIYIYIYMRERERLFSFFRVFWYKYWSEREREREREREIEKGIVQFFLRVLSDCKCRSDEVFVFVNQIRYFRYFLKIFIIKGFKKKLNMSTGKNHI